MLLFYFIFNKKSIIVLMGLWTNLLDPSIKLGHSTFNFYKHFVYLIAGWVGWLASR